MNELVITGYQNHNISAFFEDGRMTQVYAFQEKKSAEIGNIYVGRIDNIVKNINAAFVNISEKCSCYLDLSTTKQPLFVKRQSEAKICIGDELLVQLMKDEVKTKAPVVTTNFSLTGKYVILIHGGQGIQISKKIVQKSIRNTFREILSEFESSQYGIIVRTNAVTVSAEDLKEELQYLLQQYQSLCTEGLHQSKYTLVHEELPTYLVQLRDISTKQLDQIITDIPFVFDEVTAYLKQYPNFGENGVPTQIKFVQDKAELCYRYRINHFMDMAIRRILYLNSGATIVIDQTEAMTVIDVNTGKAVSGKKAVEQTFLNINLEAAREIARQIRLRNLSGIILIDFINLSEPQNMELLIEEVKLLLKEDSVQAEFVDITKLGLMEITRKKVYKTLAEQLEQ